jgi:hypothetical protein
LVVPDVCAAQLVPPVLVATIVPSAPAVQQWLKSLHATPLSWLTVPDVCADHVPANAGTAGDRANVSPTSAATRSSERLRRRPERSPIGGDARITVVLG